MCTSATSNGVTRGWASATGGMQPNPMPNHQARLTVRQIQTEFCGFSCRTGAIGYKVGCTIQSTHTQSGVEKQLWDGLTGERYTTEHKKTKPMTNLSLFVYRSCEISKSGKRAPAPLRALRAQPIAARCRSTSRRR